MRFATRFSILLAASCAASDASAQSGEGFYKNKTVHLVLSTGPAGGYALYGRLLAHQ